ncbi:hypothetical protein QZH41_004241 [Actinostola sp. cb2023]|nr:hypothetical protein QZH41_004241 [Actinostola sp. cb2023]
MDGRGFYSPFNSFYNDQYSYPTHYETQQQAPQASNFQQVQVQYPVQVGASNVPGLNVHPTAAQASTSTATQDSPEAESDSSGHGKRVYEKWTQEEQKLLVNLWAEDFDRIESKDSRKVWDEIADKINKNCKAKRSKRSTDKFQKKMKYLLDRYKKAKDWNSKQTGGNRKKSIFYDEIDEVLGCREIVALKHVEEAGSSASNTCTAESSSTSYSDEEDIQDRKVKRTERKKNRKRAIEQEAEEEERKLMKSAVSGLEAQRSDMNSFVQNFNRIQTDQLNTMNTLVSALTKFLEKQ